MEVELEQCWQVQSSKGREKLVVESEMAQPEVVGNNSKLLFGEFLKFS